MAIPEIPVTDAKPAPCQAAECLNPATWTTHASNERRPDMGSTQVCDAHLAEPGLCQASGLPDPDSWTVVPIHEGSPPYCLVSCPTCHPARPSADVGDSAADREFADAAALLNSLRVPLADNHRHLTMCERVSWLYQDAATERRQRAEHAKRAEHLAQRVEQLKVVLWAARRVQHAMPGAPGHDLRQALIGCDGVTADPPAAAAAAREFADVAPLLGSVVPDALRRALRYSVVDVVFDGPPGPVCGRFVEVEDLTGASIRAGTWIDRGNGLWALRIAIAGPLATRAVEVGIDAALGEIARQGGPAAAALREARGVGINAAEPFLAPQHSRPPAFVKLEAGARVSFLDHVRGKDTDGTLADGEVVDGSVRVTTADGESLLVGADAVKLYPRDDGVTDAAVRTLEPAARAFVTTSSSFADLLQAPVVRTALAGVTIGEVFRSAVVAHHLTKDLPAPSGGDKAEDREIPPADLFGRGISMLRRLADEASDLGAVKMADQLDDLRSRLWPEEVDDDAER